MPVIVSTVNSLQEFATWLLDHAMPNIFKSVSYAEDVLTATDENDNSVFEIKNGNDGHLRAYQDESSYLEIALMNFPSTTSEENKRINIIGCDNGFIVDMKIGTRQGSGYAFAFMVAKTNNDKIAVIFPSAVGYAALMQFTTNIRRVAFGDHLTMTTTLTFTPESAGQTVLAPFATDPQVGNVSYTPYAFYIPVSQSYSIGLGKFRLGSDTYITNGYWCIKT